MPLLHAPLASFVYLPQGCVVIFLSYFLALLVKVDAMGEHGRSAFAGLLIAINVILLLAVFVACWFTVKKTVDAVQKTADNSRDKNGIITKGVLIQAAEQDTTNTPGSCEMDAF